MKRWLALVVLALGLMVGLSKASGATVSGLSVVGYSIDQVPPEQSDSLYPQCGDGNYPNINQSWDAERFQDCGWDNFMLHYRGFITIPDGVQSVRFAIASDDGSDVTINSTNFGSWTDKACSVDYSDRVTLPTDTPLPLDAWFYENGGQTCFMLFWQFDGDNQDWSVVPESAFSAVVPTTTTTSSTTTTTTTELPSTFSSVPPSSTPIMTSPANSLVDTVVPSSSTSSTQPPEPSTTPTTQVEITPPESSTSTSSTSPQTTQPVVVPSSTTSEPANRGGQVGTTTIMPTTSVQKPVETTSTLPPITTTPTTSTTLPASPTSIPPEQAVALATNPTAVANLTPEQASVVFASIDENTLTPDQAAQLVAAVQHAPAKVRKAFEKKVPVFGGKFENYVPLGSRVPVKTRRIIIIGTVVIAGLTVRRRKP